MKDGRTLPAQAILLPDTPTVNGQPLPERSVPIRERKTVPTAWLQLTLTEGRNRQVRRMVEALDSHVLKLVRVRIGTIAIGSLPIGKWRHLTPAEVASLTDATASA